MYPVIRLLSCNHHNYRNKTSIKLLDPAEFQVKSSQTDPDMAWYRWFHTSPLCDEWAREETNSKTNCH
uniref:Uncharacterized protein n=1 Tax=Salix viminalis TaxID=40686 RepID=A0A6N2MSG5_SALVM